MRFVATISQLSCFCFFFFNDTATTEIYTLSLHDALPISFQQPQRADVGEIGGDELGQAAGERLHARIPGDYERQQDRKSTRLNSSHSQISYAVFCLKKKKKTTETSKITSRGSRSCEVYTP